MEHENLLEEYNKKELFLSSENEKDTVDNNLKKIA